MKANELGDEFTRMQNIIKDLEGANQKLKEDFDLKLQEKNEEINSLI